MEAAVVAAIIAAGAAGLSAILSAVTAILTNSWKTQNDRSIKRLEQQFSERQREIDYRRRQLNDFYGQVYMLRRRSESLRRLLPQHESTGEDWALVDHIVEVRNGSNEKWKQAVETILELDKKIADLLTTNVGLYQQFPPPASYSTFVQHYGLLHLAWDQSQNQRREERVCFPRQLDDDLNAAIEAIKWRLDELVTASSDSRSKGEAMA